MMDQHKVAALKNIVNSVLNLDVDQKGREKELVYARSICYKIMRDEMFYTLSFIGKKFGKHHASVIHSLKEFEWIAKFDKDFERSYVEILSLWKKESHDYVELDPFELKNKLNDLENSNKMLTLSLIDVQEKLETIQGKERKYDKKYKSIVALIEERVPEKKLNELELKLNQVINGL
mgnify:FL=1|jgi:hypothetical protein|tara:strand:+ start:76 stop:606 length:531 start_codon:yes stop_codon:yes gene_type:complete